MYFFLHEIQQWRKIEFLESEIERYGVLKDIGTGNCGVARLVRDKCSGRLYSVKYIERGKKIDEHVQREIMNRRSLKHPNIISLKKVLWRRTARTNLFDSILDGL